MRTTFHPNDLKSLDGMIDGIIPNGSAFIVTAAGEKIYAPSRVIEGKNVQPGDGLRCWCVPNDPEHENQAQYKAIRAMVTHRLIEGRAQTRAVVPLQPAYAVPDVRVAETPKAPPVAALDGDELKAMIDVVIDTAKVYTAKEVYSEICKATPGLWKDAKLSAKVANTLVAMASDGDVAAAKLYAATSQGSATAVYYARTVELIIMHMKGEIA